MVSFSDDDDPQAWIFLRSDAIPDRWSERALAGSLVPLLPEETDHLIHFEAASSDLSFEEDRMLRLIARNASPRAIASELDISLRSVHRRLARLRDHFNVRSTADLAVLLARRGFGA